MAWRRSRIACLFAAAVLALPGAAWGQGAGDDQYQDPFGDEEQEQPEPAPAPEEPAPSDDGGTQTAPPAPAPAAPAATTAQAPNGEAQLPRTGADEGLVALAGVVLLVGGVALRVRLSERAQFRR